MRRNGFVLPLILITITFVAIVGVVLYFQSQVNTIGKQTKESKIAQPEISKPKEIPVDFKGKLLFRDGNDIFVINSNNSKTKVANYPILSQLKKLQLSPSVQFLMGIEGDPTGIKRLEEGSQVVIDLKSGSVRKICEDDKFGAYSNPTFHPNKALTIYIMNSTLVTCDIVSNTRGIIIKNITPFNGASYSPDGSRILLHYAHGGPSVGSDYAVINNDGANKQTLPLVFTNEITDFDWSKDSDGLIANLNGEIKLYSLNSGKFSNLFSLPKLPEGFIWGYNIHSSFEKVALTIVEKDKSEKPYNSYNIYILDLKTNNLRRITNFDTTSFRPNLYSPAWWNNSILFWRTREESLQPTKDLWVVNEDGSELKMLIEDIDRPYKNLFNSEDSV